LTGNSQPQYVIYQPFKVIIISSHFFTVSNYVGIIGYNGVSYKKGDKIEIEDSDINNFESKWLVPIETEPKKPEVKPEKAEKPAETKTTKPKEESLAVKTIDKPKNRKRTL